MTLAAFVLRRLALGVPLVVAALTLVFLLVETAPGDPVDRWLGDSPVPPDVRARIESAYGLDRPPLARYTHWLGAVARGELGWSHSRARPVARLVAETLPATLLLSGAALGLHLLLGIAVGVACAASRGGWVDRLLGAASLLLCSLPLFWLGVMAILGLSYAIPLFPAASMRGVGAADASPAARLADLAWHLALPACVLGVAAGAALSRFVRAGLLESLGLDSIRAARARGVGAPRVLVAHALRGALGPVVHLAGLSLPVLVSGSLVIEVVFSWPGMGRLTYEAILAKDLPVVLSTTLLATGLVVAGSLAADVLVALLDPRVRLVGAGSGR